MAVTVESVIDKHKKGLKKKKKEGKKPSKKKFTGSSGSTSKKKRVAMIVGIAAIGFGVWWFYNKLSKPKYVDLKGEPKVEDVPHTDIPQ